MSMEEGVGFMRKEAREMASVLVLKRSCSFLSSIWFTYQEEMIKNSCICKDQLVLL